MSIASFFLVFEKERSCDCHDSSVFGAWDLFMQTFFLALWALKNPQMSVGYIVV